MIDAVAPKGGKKIDLHLDFLNVLDFTVGRRSRGQQLAEAFRTQDDGIRYRPLLQVDRPKRTSCLLPAVLFLTCLHGSDDLHRMTLLRLGLVLSLMACAPTVKPGARAKAKIHYDIAVTAMNQNNNRMALKELRVSIEADPAFPPAYNALGLVYHALKQRSDAEDAYQKALELKPDFSEAQNNYGILLTGLGRYAEAIVQFKEALSNILYTTPSLAEGNLGWAYYLKGETAVALQHLRNATATNPKFCRGYEWLMRIGHETQKWEQVIANGQRFEKYCLGDESIAAQVTPRYTQTLLWYVVQAHDHRGDAEQARVVAQSCASHDRASSLGQKCAAFAAQ